MYIPPPVNIQNREWMFKGWNGGSYRHSDPETYITFQDQKEMWLYLAKNVPRAAYVSIAQYKNPAKREGWMGGDLVFDIDYDHIKRDATFEEGHELARQETFKVISILSTDFGIEDIDVVFSGRRGYHIKCRDEGLEKIMNRAEIADYFTQRNMSSRVLSKDSIIMFVEYLSGLEKNEARAELSDCDIPARRISTIINKADQIIEQIKNNRLDAYVPMDTWSKIVPWYRCEIDVSVTSDEQKQLRLPCSLHNETGLRAVPLDIDMLKTFNPPSDASPFPDEDVLMITSEGEKVEVPIHEGLIGCFSGAMKKA